MPLVELRRPGIIQDTVLATLRLWQKLTTDNLDRVNASAGDIGSFSSSVVASSCAVVLTSTVAATVTSLALPAGNWLVSGQIVFSGAGTGTKSTATIGTEDAVLGTDGSEVPTGHSSTVGYSLVVASKPVVLAVATTLYLVGKSTFSSTASAYGHIRAWRFPGGENT